MDKSKLDYCPLPLQNNKLNVKNHLHTIEVAKLGPADPTQSNPEFWREKAMRWGTTEGLARGRLCNNCEYYNQTPEIQDCIANGPAYDLKASDLPVKPKWVDVEDHPVAYCVKFDITCSPIRTCDYQEIGFYEEGEDMEDEEEVMDVNEDPFEDTTKEE